MTMVSNLLAKCWQSIGKTMVLLWEESISVHFRLRGHKNYVWTTVAECLSNELQTMKNVFTTLKGLQANTCFSHNPDFLSGVAFLGLSDSSLKFHYFPIILVLEGISAPYFECSMLKSINICTPPLWLISPCKLLNRQFSQFIARVCLILKLSQNVQFKKQLYNILFFLPNCHHSNVLMVNVISKNE